MHRPITTCSLTTTPEHLPAQAAFSLKTFELGIPSSFAIASGTALSPEWSHTIAVRVDSHRPTKPHATSCAGNTGVNALTDVWREFEAFLRTFHRRSALGEAKRARAIQTATAR